MASLCDDHGYVVEKLKCNARIFLTVDIAVTTSHDEMVLFYLIRYNVPGLK